MPQGCPSVIGVDALHKGRVVKYWASRLSGKETCVQEPEKCKSKRGMLGELKRVVDVTVVLGR